MEDIKAITPLKDNVIGRVHHEEMKTASGIFIKDDLGKEQGIRPRWCRVKWIGPEQTDVKPGDWVLVEHGRWGYESKLKINGREEFFSRIDPKAIMAISEQAPEGIDPNWI